MIHLKKGASDWPELCKTNAVWLRVFQICRAWRPQNYVNNLLAEKSESSIGIAINLETG
jgi:hypothetical protein